MSTGDLLSIHPSELQFSFELRKQSLCSVQLTNKSEQHVAYKVKTTNPKKYCVRPNTGVISPGSASFATVTMQGQKELPPDMQCKDKFLIQCVVVPDGFTTKDLNPELFNKQEGKVVEEFKLRVVYIPVNPPSPVPEESVPEESEEGSPPRLSAHENDFQNASLASAVTSSLEEPKEKSEAWSLVSKLTEERTSAIQQNQRLRQELDMMRKEMSKNRSGRFSMLFMVLVGILGILIGYLLKRT